MKLFFLCFSHSLVFFFFTFVLAVLPSPTQTVCFVPRRSLLCDQILNDDSVARTAVARITEFPLYLIPFDDDVLSMEAIADMRTTRVDGDPTELFNAARALMKLQTAYGTIPHIYGKGHYAKQLCDMLLRMRNEAVSDASVRDAESGAEGTAAAAAAAAAAAEEVPPEIGSLLIVDREVDMITPMMTQLSFEGAVDEVYGITNGHIELEAEVVSPPPPPGVQTDKPVRQYPPGKKLNYPLNSNDSVYAVLRDLNCAAVGKFLAQRARELSAFEQSRKTACKSVAALREWMKKFPAMQAEKNSVRIFAHVMEHVQAEQLKSPRFRERLEAEQTLICSDDEDGAFAFIEDCVLRGEPLEDVLRLLVIQAQTRGGFRAKVAEQLRHELVQTYGYEALFTLERLERLGLLARTQTRTAYPAVFRALRLVPDTVDETSLHPDDPAYVFSGYAPIVARIAEALGRVGGWRSIDDALRALPGGPVFDVEQVPHAKRPPVTLVFVLGGITHAEISALRILSRLEGGNHCDYIAATTKIVNGRSLVRSLIDPFPSPQDPVEFATSSSSSKQ